MRTRIRTGSQNKFKINDRLAGPANIKDGDIFDVDIKTNQIVLRKSDRQTEE